MASLNLLIKVPLSAKIVVKAFIVRYDGAVEENWVADIMKTGGDGFDGFQQDAREGHSKYRL